MLRAILTVAALLVVHGVGYAEFEIEATPSSSSGPFLHNVFHTASNSSGNGSALVWFDLDTGQTSTFDPDSGQLVLHVNLYSDMGLTNSVGTATAQGDFTPSAFNGYDGGIVGTMDWTFNVSDSSNSNVQNFVNRIGGTDGSTTMTFFDEDYVVSSSGNRANSLSDPIAGGRMTLWGANGTPDAGNSTYSGQNLGMDLVMSFSDSMIPVPGPPSIILALMGIACCPLLRRRAQTVQR